MLDETTIAMLDRYGVIEGTVLEEVASDAAVLHMEKEDLIEDFLIAYQEALGEIGFTSRDIARMAAAALAV